MIQRSMRTAFIRYCLLAITILVINSSNVWAATQASGQSAVERAQAAVREKILRERGSNLDVSFPDWAPARTYYVSSNQTGVRGEGVYAVRDNYRQSQNFSYDVVINNRNGRVERVDYTIGGGTPQINDYRRNYLAPDWLVGTFEGKNPSSKEKMSLSIDRSGYAYVRYEKGGTEDGQYANGQISFNRSLPLEVSQSGKDIRLRDSSTGRSEKLKRTSDYSVDYGSGSTSVPQWAIGTFRGNPDRGESEVSIGPDGTAVSRSIRTHQLSIGRYVNGVLSFDFGSYNLSRDGNGIRTTEVSNRRNQVSYRRVD